MNRNTVLPAHRHFLRPNPRAKAFSMRIPAAFAVLFALMAPSAQAQTAAPATLYRHVTIIDGTGAAPRPGMDLLVRGERIVSLGVALPPVADAREVDATGLYVTPGLINTHEHVATPPNRPYALAQMKRDLYGGVTSVRDMADDLRQVGDLARAAVDATRFQGGDNPVTAALFRTMKARGVPLDATLLVYQGLDEAHAAHPDRPPGYCSLDLAAKLTAQARREGVIVTAGADILGDAADPYPALYRELALLVDRAGFTPPQAIRAATGDAALAVRRDPDFGTIAPGKLAALTSFAKDPSADIRALTSATFTIKRGVAWPRADYHPLADQAARKED
jgi:imidazolonepropionase-like amidohydrolase